MTARYNVFKDSTPCCDPPTAYGMFVGPRQAKEQTRLGLPPGSQLHHPNSVVNVPNVRRGEDVSN